MIPRIPRWFCAACLALVLMASQTIFAQASPELSMRDFASGQVKKGARSIGFGATVTLDYGSLLHKR